jgi:hypothetical protein
MKLAIADINGAKLAQVKVELVKTLGEQNVISVVTDVSKLEDVKKLSNTVFDQWGEVRFTLLCRLKAILTHRG